jgi:hypothetical protein
MIDLVQLHARILRLGGRIFNRGLRGFAYR